MSESAQQVTSNLQTVRTRAGVSAAALAQLVGVSRQTIYAIEKGTYLPNTVLGLRLARALGVTVEELFSLPEPSLRRTVRKVTLVNAEELRMGQPVQLCRVDRRLLAVSTPPSSAFFPASDALLGSSGRGTAQVVLHNPEATLDNRLLLAGCDPAMALLARHLRPAGIDVVLMHQNSSQALRLLRRGLVHIAGTHLPSEEAQAPNVSAIQQHLPKSSVAAFSFAQWEEGFVVASGNPKHIQGAQDLARRGVRFQNREPGAGSRLLLDRELAKLGMATSRLSGYHQTAHGHLAAVWEVKRGSADCCLATRAAATFYGLDFLPLQISRYDLVIRKQHLHMPAMQTVLDVLNRSPFRSELQAAVGYNTAVTGTRIL